MANEVDTIELESEINETEFLVEVNEQGPPGAPGKDGIGVPDPTGNEGRILQVVNGVPTWV